jgi:DNA-binding MarR family transcriptional regulator
MESPCRSNSAASIGEGIDAATDLNLRFLADRDGLSASASLALNKIGRGGPMRVTALAATEGIRQPAMTQLVQRLERQGLLERWSDPNDGRASLVSIGQAGRELLDQQTTRRRARLAELLTRLSPKDEMALWLALGVATPILRELSEATSNPSPARVDIARTER